MKAQTVCWFWSFVAIYLFLYASNKLGYQFPKPIQNYLSDLLAIPITATLALCLLKFVHRQKDYILAKWQIAYIIIVFCIAFELLLPLFMKRYTADVFDAFAYFLGGLFFWRIMNK